MADIFKFPNGGYDVVVCRKQDIIDCIDKNIIDKEVALDIVTQCEKDAIEFIKQGRWAGIPFIGNIRVPKLKQLQDSEEQKELIDSAKEVLDKEQFVMFRKRLTIDNTIRIKNERYFKYIVSMEVNKNKSLFKKLSKTKGEHYAKVYLFATHHVTAIDRDPSLIYYNE